MKIIGIFLFFVGLVLMYTMITMNPVAFLDEYYIYENNNTIVGNRDLITILGSTLTIVGTIMAIFCNSVFDTKKCAFCNETISKRAKKCKYCHEWDEEQSK